MHTTEPDRSLRQLLDKAIELDPNYAEPHVNRGLIYDNQGDYTKALSDFNKTNKSGDDERLKEVKDLKFKIKALED